MKPLNSVCPLDCPAACALEIKLNNDGSIHTIAGDKSHDFTAGVICKKVKNFKKRLDNPNRLTKALKRVGKKGSAADGTNRFEEIEIGEALAILGQKFQQIKEEYGSESLWPYHYAGTMGWCSRDGIHRLSHRFGLSKMKGSFCINMGNAGWNAGFGRVLGVDPLECYKAKQVIIWGQNPQVTQIPLMAHLIKARQQTGVKLIGVDVYQSETMDICDEAYIIHPGSDGALALGMMHYILAQNWQDDAYLQKYTDFNQETRLAIEEWPLERTAARTGLSAAQIIKFATDYAQNPQTILRAGYGLTRRRSGASNLHAISCLPALLGHWQHEGGGAFWSLSGHYDGLSREMFSGTHLGKAGRELDQSLIGAILNGDKQALKGGGPVKAMLIQNTNPVNVAAQTELVKKGFLREDLFTCVHEQFMTDTAKYADLVIPATAFIEHDDIYSQGGWHWLHIAPKLREPLGDCIENHELVNYLARYLGAEEDDFNRSSKAHIQHFLDLNNLGSFDDFVAKKGQSFALPFEEQHFLNGFHHKDKLFHFHPDWSAQGYNHKDMKKAPYAMEDFADSQKEYPYRLVVPPKMDRLNSTFSEITSGSEKGQSQPVAYIGKELAEAKGFKGQEALITLFNGEGRLTLKAVISEKAKNKTIIIEGVFPRHCFEEGHTNDLITMQPAPPNDGLIIHDIAVDFLVKEC